MSNAAILFAKLYSVQLASQMGFDMNGINLQTASVTTNTGLNKIALDAASFLSKLNKGMMKEMQQDPSDELNDCFRTVAETNALLLKTLDFASYSTGGFNIGSFGEKTQLMNLKFTSEIEKCGYSKYLMAFDTMTNNIP